MASPSSASRTLRARELLWICTSVAICCFVQREQPLAVLYVCGADEGRPLDEGVRRVGMRFASVVADGGEGKGVALARVTNPALPAAHQVQVQPGPGCAATRLPGSLEGWTSPGDSARCYRAQRSTEEQRSVQRSRPPHLRKDVGA